MKIGEAFTYKIDDQTKVIRKEKSFYITFILEERLYYELDELPVQVIKHTLANTLPLLEKNIAKRHAIPLPEVKKTIKEIQKKLHEINLL